MYAYDTSSWLALAVPLELPTEVRLEFVPNGGLLCVRLIHVYRLFLAARRCDLIAALLQPPAGYERSAFIPDDFLMPRIWGLQSKTRTHLNTLIHRTRTTLARAVPRGATLLERAPGGGATRFLLDRAATVHLA